MKPCIVARLKTHFTREAHVVVEGEAAGLISVIIVCAYPCLYTVYHYMLALVLLNSVTKHRGKHTIQCV